MYTNGFFLSCRYIKKEVYSKIKEERKKERKKNKMKKTFLYVHAVSCLSTTHQTIQTEFKPEFV